MNDLEWLTINYTLPKEPSRTRVSVWRRLKKKRRSFIMSIRMGATRE